MGEKIDQWAFERALYLTGMCHIAGTDEVGRGCLAGPVVAASVILPRDCKIVGINDSKLISPKKREKLYEEILASAIAVGIGLVTSEEIDRINILQASLKAMKIAVEKLDITPQYVLIDGRNALSIDIPQKPIIRGDQLSISIGASSIVAKVFRDRMMAELEKDFPGFKFSAHKGYGTAKHFGELKKHGPTPFHRRTFLKKYDNFIQR